MRYWTTALLVGASLGATTGWAQPPEHDRPPPAQQGARPGGPGRGPGADGQRQAPAQPGGAPRGTEGGRPPSGGNGGPGRGPGFDRGPVANQFNGRGGYDQGAGGRPDGPGRDRGPGDRPAPGGDPSRGGPGGWHGQDRGGVAVWRGDRGPSGGDPRWRGGRPGGGGFQVAGRPDGRGGGWNRGWRDDHRYDWRGWRDGHGDRFRQGPYRVPYGYGGGYRHYGIGGVIGAPFFAQSYWIADPYSYRLPPAYPPYRWVRYFNDVLLVDTYSGRVVDAIPGFFW